VRWGLYEENNEVRVEIYVGNVMYVDHVMGKGLRDFWKVDFFGCNFFGCNFGVENLENFVNYSVMIFYNVDSLDV
jgi:hypothetical protein